MSLSLLSRFNAPGPKKILSLDGGGIRGVITLGFLKRIESELRIHTNKDDLVLSDYFDLIGGTSTGSIIAAFLAMGRPVDEISRIYNELGPRIFKPKRWYFRLLGPLPSLFTGKFSDEEMQLMLQDHFKDWTLGDERMRTGLCIFTTMADKRATTPFCNHPRSRGYGDTGEESSAYSNLPDKVKCGKRTIMISDIIRASTAAPGTFKPKEIRYFFMDHHKKTHEPVRTEVTGAFIDGGIGSLNNPALYLFLMSTLNRFPFRWKTGRDDILMVSVGTGFSDYREGAQDILKKKFLPQFLGIIVDNFLQDASEMNQTVLQSLAHTPQPTFIDEELGDLKDEYLGGQPMLTYLRYNAQFNKEPMSRVGMEKYNDQLGPLHSLDNPGNIPKLDEIGKAFAEDMVKGNHFEGFV